MQSVMTRRVISLLSILAFLSIKTAAQIYDPVSWEFSYEKKDGNNYELVFTALIEKGSHIYSMDVPEGGPIPTTFTFSMPDEVQPDGNAYEATEPEELFDEFDSRIFLVDQNAVAKVLPDRPKESHKGIFGTVLIVGGSSMFPGAPLLAAKAAYQMGAGLVQVASTSLVQTSMASACPEATWFVLSSSDLKSCLLLSDIFSRLKSMPLRTLHPTVKGYPY